MNSPHFSPSVNLNRPWKSWFGQSMPQGILDPLSLQVTLPNWQKYIREFHRPLSNHGLHLLITGLSQIWQSIRRVQALHVSLWNAIPELGVINISLSVKCKKDSPRAFSWIVLFCFTSPPNQHVAATLCTPATSGWKVTLTTHSAPGSSVLRSGFMKKGLGVSQEKTLTRSLGNGDTF